MIQKLLILLLFAQLNGMKPKAEECAICLFEMTSNESVIQFDCDRTRNINHRFHVSCIKGWIEIDKTLCPICNRALIILNEGPGNSRYAGDHLLGSPIDSTGCRVDLDVIMNKIPFEVYRNKILFVLCECSIY